jgi:hypothetical protein
MAYSRKERGRIRSLTERVAAVAQEPRMAAIKQRWADVNALRKPNRALVWCRPVGCRKEILTEGMLECNEGWLRQLEHRLLQILHERDIGDDHPVEGCFEVPAGLLSSATLGTASADLRGPGQMMIDMIAASELMHRLMAYLRDANLAALDWLEATGLITPNNVGPMTCSDPIGAPEEGGKPSCKNLWCMVNSQEFDPVSSAMWETFCLTYQKPILARFGSSQYSAELAERIVA